jgi:hypothetical protein
VPRSSTVASTVFIITAFYRRIDRNEPLKSGRFFGTSLDWRTKSKAQRPKRKAQKDRHNR